MELIVLLMLAMILFGALFRFPWIIFLATSFSVILLTANIWKKFVLKKLEYKRILKYSKGFPGEVLKITIQVGNKKKLPVSWLLCEDTWPSALHLENDTNLAPSYVENKSYLINSFGLNSYQLIKRDYSFQLTKRGIYRLGPISLESSDLFGFFHITQVVEQYDYVTVYPEIFPLSDFNFKTEDPFGLQQSKTKIFDDPILYSNIRDYRHGDPMKNIHWNATAKKNNLQVKILQPVSEKVVVLMTNIHTSDKQWLGTNQEQFEYLLSLSGSLIADLVSKEYAVGLLSNGCRSFSDQPVRIFPGKSNQQILLLLEALASLTQYTSDHNFANFIFNNISTVPYGSSIIVITNQISDNLLSSIQSLTRYRLNINLIYTGELKINHDNKINFFHLPLKTNE